MPLMSHRTMRLDSCLSEIRTAEQSPAPQTARTEATRYPDMGMLMENMKTMFNGVVTEVKNLVTQTKEEISSQKFEAQVNRSEVPNEKEGESCKKCKGSQVMKNGKPCKKCADQVECLAEHIDCFKCKGTKLNKKGDPCGKCKKTGKFCLEDMGDMVEQAQEEIKLMCNETFMKNYHAHKGLMAQ